MINKSIQSQHNMIEYLSFFTTATNNKSIASGAIHGHHHVIIWEKAFTEILNSPAKWRDNRMEVDKTLSVLAVLDSGGPDETG